MLATKAEKRAGARLLRGGSALVPTEVSWRIAEKMKRLGWATLYPFHERWLGRMEITEAGRAALRSEFR